MNDQELQLPEIANGEDKSSPFINCLRNHYRHLRKFAKRTLTNCFRIYDFEIKQFPLAIDFYAGRFCVHYYSSGIGDEKPGNELVEQTQKALCETFGITPDFIFWRSRMKSKPSRQYEKLDEAKDFFVALEYGVKFKINLTDYLDTGLFLDHRETRRLVALQSKGKKILNLFSYTGSFSVHAAVAGAAFTKSVDMSNTYTDWNRDNFTLNGISQRNHCVVRADCLKFLDEELRAGEMYDIIIIDPPTISRSKKMDQLFDIQKDYISILSKAIKLLRDQGIIFFSTNSRKFSLDESFFPSCKVEDISHKTVPVDFQGTKIHRCWTLREKKPA